MATTYPTTVDVFPIPSGSSLLTSPDHADHHNSLGSAIEALESKVGVGAGSASLNTILVGTGSGTSLWSNVFNNGTIGTATLNNGTANNMVIGTPSVTGGTITAYQSTYHTLGSAASTPGTATTGTLNLSSASRFLVTMPNAAGQVTLAVSSASLNQPFLIEILQGTAGLGTVNWFGTIKWAGSAAPVQTLTASRKDTFGFITTGTANFDGYIVGTNV